MSFFPIFFALIFLAVYAIGFYAGSNLLWWAAIIEGAAIAGVVWYIVKSLI